jgi:hypothetical protein
MTAGMKQFAACAALIMLLFAAGRCLYVCITHQFLAMADQ